MEASVAGYFHSLASNSRYTNEFSPGMTGILRRMMAALHVICCSRSSDDVPPGLTGPENECKSVINVKCLTI